MALFPACIAIGDNPALGPARPTCGIQDIFQLFFNTYDYLLGAAAAVCILMIIIGGIAFMASGSEGTTKWGKATLINALFGLGIILLSFLIIKTLLSVLGISPGFQTELNNYHIGL